MTEGLITLGVDGEKVQHQVKIKIKKITNNQLCSLITHLGLIKRNLENLYSQRVNQTITKE